MMNRILLILSIIVFAGNSSCTQKAKSAEVYTTNSQEITVARNVDTKVFNSFLKEKKTAVLIDVRTPQEVAQGYIEGARNIDINSQDFRPKVEKLDKTQPVLVYCRSGRRSEAAMRYMQDQGFSEVYNLNGGILAWSQAGLPIVK